MEIATSPLQACPLNSMPKAKITTLRQREAQVADDSNGGPIVATAPQNVAEKNKNIYKTFWHALPGNADKTDRIHKEICHWRANFILLNKNKTGPKFVECFDENLKQFTERGIYEELSIKVTAIIPHLVLPRVKLTNDGSVTKTLARCLQLWCQGCFIGLLLEAEILQYKHRKTPKIKIGKWNSSINSRRPEKFWTP